MNSRHTYVITLSTSQTDQQSRIWDSQSPIAIGTPFRWVLERTERGVRIRSLKGEFGKLNLSSVQEITHSRLDHENELPLDGGAKLRIRPARPLSAAFENTGQLLSQDSILRAHACIGDWIYQTQSFTTKWKAIVKGESLFELIREGSQFKVSDSHSTLKWISSDGLAEKAEGLSLSFSELTSGEFRKDRWAWRFEAAPTVSFTEVKPAVDPENIWFKRAVRASLLGLAVFIGLSLIWPKHKVDELELIPPQFAKIVLTQQPTRALPAQSQPAGASTAVPSSQNPSAPKKVEKAAVVQAFRAKALQNAISGLVKGGMTQLLAQSDFVSGSTGTDQAKRIFNTRTEALRATGQNTGLMSSKDIKVAAIGGGTVGGTTGGQGVGYGKGEKASVKGQGKSLISLDTPGAAVEEGLTKDEVGEVIHRHLSEVRYCYESAMLRQPDIEGKLVINFTISGQGNVKSSEVKQSTLPDPRLDDCVIRRLGTWKFPKTKGGIDVAVSYPFLFKTLGR